MRDTYVFALFLTFIVCATILSYSGKLEPIGVLVPLMTGFLGLLVDKPKSMQPTLTNRIMDKLTGSTSLPPPPDSDAKGDNR